MNDLEITAECVPDSVGDTDITDPTGSGDAIPSSDIAVSADSTVPADDASADDAAADADIPAGSDTKESPVPEDTDALREELSLLQQQLTHLRQELADRKADLERMDRECSEFRELYPGVSVRDLPDAVLDDVRRGIPLAAAYALAERRDLLTRRQAETSNQHNLLRSPGAVERRESGYFSPDEVRAMSREEVRKQYKNILRSMQKWT